MSSPGEDGVQGLRGRRAARSRRVPPRPLHPRGSALPAPERGASEPADAPAASRDAADGVVSDDDRGRGRPDATGWDGVADPDSGAAPAGGTAQQPAPRPRSVADGGRQPTVLDQPQTAAGRVAGPEGGVEDERTPRSAAPEEFRSSTSREEQTTTQVATRAISHDVSHEISHADPSRSSAPADQGTGGSSTTDDGGPGLPDLAVRLDPSVAYMPRPTVLSIPYTVMARFNRARRDATSHTDLVLDALRATIERLPEMVAESRPKPATGDLFSSRVAVVKERREPLRVRPSVADLAVIDRIVGWVAEYVEARFPGTRVTRSDVVAVALDAYLPGRRSGVTIEG